MTVMTGPIWTLSTLSTPRSGSSQMCVPGMTEDSPDVPSFAA